MYHKLHCVNIYIFYFLKHCIKYQIYSYSNFAVLCSITGDTLTNGIISYSDSRRPIVAGTVATYTCVTGYTLDGTDTRTCVDSPRFSGWSSEVPTCISELQGFN